MAASQDKLLYLNAKARGEAIRMLYALGGEKYEDKRVDFQDLPQIKGDLPLGQVPTLETKHGVLTQSNSIARYVAKKLGLAGKELWEEALHDVVIEAVQACIDAYAVPNIYAWKVFKFIPTPENSEQILEDAKNKWIKVLNYIESIAEKRGKKYIIGDSPGLAECWLYAALDFCKVGCPDLMNLTPWTKGFTEAVEADSKLKKYLAERPKSLL